MVADRQRRTRVFAVLLAQLTVFHTHLIQAANQQLVLLATGLVVLQQYLLEFLVFDFKAVGPIGLAFVPFKISFEHPNLFRALFEIGKQSLIVIFEMGAVSLVNFRADL